MPIRFIVGKSIYLSPVETEDVELYLAWLNDRQVTKFLTMRRPIARAAERKMLERIATNKTDIVLGIRLKENDELIGGAGLHSINPIDRSATFGIFIGEKSKWSKGYGAEATRLMVGYGFNALNLNRIELDVMSYNPRGVRCYENVGFKKEGVMRQAVFNDGEYHDIIRMAILREEWEDAKRKDPGVEQVLGADKYG